LIQLSGSSEQEVSYNASYVWGFAEEGIARVTLDQKRSNVCYTIRQQCVDLLIKRRALTVASDRTRKQDVTQRKCNKVSVSGLMQSFGSFEAIVSRELLVLKAGEKEPVNFEFPLYHPSIKCSRRNHDDVAK
jgi:hypothetical protein